MSVKNNLMPGHFLLSQFRGMMMYGQSKEHQRVGLYRSHFDLLSSGNQTCPHGRRSRNSVALIYLRRRQEALRTNLRRHLSAPPQIHRPSPLSS
jgi:hypothetical protein